MNFKIKSQKISELDRHQVLLEEVAWTLKEHSTKAEQQVSESIQQKLNIKLAEINWNEHNSIKSKKIII